MLTLKAVPLLVAVAAPRAAIAIDQEDTFEVKIVCTCVLVNDKRLTNMLTSNPFVSIHTTLSPSSQ